MHLPLADCSADSSLLMGTSGPREIAQRGDVNVDVCTFGRVLLAGVTAAPSNLAMLSIFSNKTKHGCQACAPSVDAEGHQALIYYSGVSHQL